MSTATQFPRMERRDPTNPTSIYLTPTRCRGGELRLLDELGRAHMDERVLVRALSARLLASSSATAALRTWCEEHGLAAGEIKAVRHSHARAHYADDALLDELRPESGEAVHHRRVDLCRSGLVLSRADNWYVPDRLPLAMRRKLETTDVPFGTVIAPLRPSRRTVFVEFLSLSRSLVPGSQPHRPEDTGETRQDEILEHRAVILIAGSCPIAVVRERYLSVLVAFAA